MTSWILINPQGAGEGAMPERPCPSTGTPWIYQKPRCPNGLRQISRVAALAAEGHTFQVCHFRSRLAMRETEQ